ncbi:MAG: diphthine synthase [Candidatus Caldarchaeum sp.]|nr:diphthine synthase [Candidatus Caldarchaeum sp.]
MTLVFVGGGLGPPGSLTFEAVEALKKCDIVYVDCYTSVWDDETLQHVRKLVKVFVKAERKTLEDEAYRLVAEATDKVVGVLAPGDPFIATTHSSLRELASRRKVKVEIVNGVSIISAAISLSGLHVYKFGKTATLPKTDDLEQYRQPLHVLEENLSRHAHTLFLLDTAEDGLTVPEAIRKLILAARKMGKNFVDDHTLAISLARVGYLNSVVRAGTFEQLCLENYPPPPHCLIIPSAMHFSEKEAVKTYAINPDEMEKIKPVNPLSERLSTYIDKCRRFIEHASQNESLKQYVNYVNCYVDDAVRFMSSGDYVDALLSAGYAEGLLDALRLRGEVSFEW